MCPGANHDAGCAAPAARSGPLTDAHGEEGRCEHGGNLLSAAYKAPPLLLRAARASLCPPVQEELLSSQYWLRGSMREAKEGRGRLPAALGTEQMQWLLDSRHCTGSTCCHWCQPFGQPVQDGVKTPGSKRTGYGQAHPPGVPEDMRNPGPGKSSYPSTPGYNSTRNNSNPRGSKPHCGKGKHHNPQTHTEQTTAGALCPQITQRMGGFQGRGPGEVAIPAPPPHRTLGSYC